MHQTEELLPDRYILTHSVGAKQSGLRLDQFLQRYYKKRSREKIKAAIREGRVHIERPTDAFHPVGTMKPSSQLMEGDLVQVVSERRPEPEVDFNYQILFQDESLFIVNKPANLPVHPAGKYFFNTLLVHLRTGGFTRPLDVKREFYLVHRIDKETSGVLVLAKERDVCANLIEQFAHRRTQKTYLAIVHGALEEKRDIDFPLGNLPDCPIRLKMGHVPLEAGGVEAVTHVEPVALYSRGERLFTLVRCYPRTGRQHQIRAHLDGIGFPLVGDKLYGLPVDIALRFFEPGNRAWKHETDPWVQYRQGVRYITPEMEDRLLLSRHALHAASIELFHPLTGIPVRCEAPLTPDLQEFLDSLKLEKKFE